MKTQHFVWKLILSLTFIVLLGGTLACEEQVAGPRTWIDVPLDGSSVPVGTAVPVVSHAYAREGVAEILLSVNGEAYRRGPPAQPDASFSKVALEWMPQQAGDYVLQVKAYSKNGQASNPATVRVRVLGKTTPTPTPPPGIAPRVISPTPTLVPAPDLTIVNVEAIVAGDKAGVPFCNTRVTYRNAGTVAIPREFTIQFHFNGTPQIANTVAGGLAPGASAEITFVYQFDGAPYIGINLDSTNVIAESSETNNAFAEIRACGATPVPTPTFTPTIPTIPLPPPPPPPVGCTGTPNTVSYTHLTLPTIYSV